MQGINKEITNVGLQSYLKELPKNEGEKLKFFIAEKFQLGYSSIDNKFRYGKFSPAELLAMQSILSVWNQ